MTGFMGMGMAMNNGAAGSAEPVCHGSAQSADTAGGSTCRRYMEMCLRRDSERQILRGMRRKEARGFDLDVFRGAVNNGKFCTSCGAKKPETVQCANCGWKPKDPTQAPKFCPECGTPFNK